MSRKFVTVSCFGATLCYMLVFLLLSVLVWMVQVWKRFVGMSSSVASPAKSHGVYVTTYTFPSKTSPSSSVSVERVPNSNFTCLIPFEGYYAQNNGGTLGRTHSGRRYYNQRLDCSKGRLRPARMEEAQQLTRWWQNPNNLVFLCRVRLGCFKVDQVAYCIHEYETVNISRTKGIDTHDHRLRNKSIPLNREVGTPYTKAEALSFPLGVGVMSWSFSVLTCSVKLMVQMR